MGHDVRINPDCGLKANCKGTLEDEEHCRCSDSGGVCFEGQNHAQQDSRIYGNGAKRTHGQSSYCSGPGIPMQS